MVENHEAFVLFGKFLQNEVLIFSCGKEAQSEPGFLVKIAEFGAWRSAPISIGFAVRKDKSLFLHGRK